MLRDMLTHQNLQFQRQNIEAAIKMYENGTLPLKDGDMAVICNGKLVHRSVMQGDLTGKVLWTEVSLYRSFRMNGSSLCKQDTGGSQYMERTTPSAVQNTRKASPVYNT